MPAVRPSARRRLAALAAVGAVTAGLAACSDSGGGSSSDALALARRLPAGEQGLVVVDLDAGRKAYGLEPDAAADLKDGYRGFAAMAASAVPSAAQSDPQLYEAIDQGAVHAVATSFGRDQVTLLRTSQPWDRFAARAAEAGWRRSGDELRRARGGVVLRDGDVWIWARTPTAAKAARQEREGAVQGLATAAQGMDGAVVVGYASAKPACTTGVLVSQVPKTLDGQTVVLTRKGAKASWGPIAPDSPWYLKDKAVGEGRLTADYHLTRGDKDNPMAAYQAVQQYFELPSEQVRCR